MEYQFIGGEEKRKKNSVEKTSTVLIADFRKYEQYGEFEEMKAELQEPLRELAENLMKRASKRMEFE